MMPIGLLMIEHRLIERMIKILDSSLEKIKIEHRADPGFIDMSIDFLRTYADRCHHGKEEDILFRELNMKELSAKHRKILEELLEEHRIGREYVKKLEEARTRYTKDDGKMLKSIYKDIAMIVKHYVKHIEKEDKHFFIPVMEYFTQQEKDAMLKEMWEFDKLLIHEKYKSVIDAHERK